ALLLVVVIFFVWYLIHNANGPPGSRGGRSVFLPSGGAWGSGGGGGGGAGGPGDQEGRGAGAAVADFPAAVAFPAGAARRVAAAHPGAGDADQGGSRRHRSRDPRSGAAYQRANGLRARPRL